MANLNFYLYGVSETQTKNTMTVSIGTEYVNVNPSSVSNSNVITNNGNLGYVVRAVFPIDMANVSTDLIWRYPLIFQFKTLSRTYSVPMCAMTNRSKYCYVVDEWKTNALMPVSMVSSMFSIHGGILVNTDFLDGGRCVRRNQISSMSNNKWGLNNLTSNNACVRFGDIVKLVVDPTYVKMHLTAQFQSDYLKWRCSGVQTGSSSGQSTSGILNAVLYPKLYSVLNFENADDFNMTLTVSIDGGNTFEITQYEVFNNESVSVQELYDAYNDLGGSNLSNAGDFYVDIRI